MAEDCVGNILSKKKAEGKEIDDQAKAIALSECGESKKAKQLDLKIAGLRKKLDRLKKANTASDNSQNKEYEKWELTHVERKGYPPNFSLGAKFASEDDEFAKYYLLDGHDTNGNGWGVTNDSIPSQIASFIGKPFVVTSNEWIQDSEYEDQYDHPYIPTNNMTAILNHQEKFRVGDIVKVARDEENGRWYAAIKLDKKFTGKTLPQFCSPAIYQLNPHEDEGSITEWTGLHLAGLDGEPAYGNRVAILRGKCVGQPGECMHQFRMGKQKHAESDTISPVKQQGQSGVTDTICDCEEEKTKKIGKLNERLGKIKEDFLKKN